MLYDPKWEQKTKADPFSLTSLIAWLEQQPADDTYCYFDGGKCLLALYFKAQGFKVHGVGGDRIRITEHEPTTYTNLPDAFASIAVDGKYTFGAALARARAARTY